MRRETRSPGVSSPRGTTRQGGLGLRELAHRPRCDPGQLGNAYSGPRSRSYRDALVRSGPGLEPRTRRRVTRITQRRTRVGESGVPWRRAAHPGSVASGSGGGSRGYRQRPPTWFSSAVEVWSGGTPGCGPGARRGPEPTMAAPAALAEGRPVGSPLPLILSDGPASPGRGRFGHRQVAPP